MTNFSFTTLLIGFLLAVLISAVAYRLRTLNRSGALAAICLGTIFFGLGGWGGAALLLGFFITSSALSRLFRQRKRKLNEKFSKGDERDAAQVFANGGIAGLFLILYSIQPGWSWAWAACAGALAAANADTWATEFGVLSRRAPRLITTGQSVERGSSGGISLTGTLAASGGALLIGLLAVLFWPTSLSFGNTLLIILLIGLGGLAGSLADSLLGATWQAIYTCPSCNKETERHPLHTCGTPTTQIRGLSWLNNDWVNTACTIVGALLSGLLLLLLLR